jgi:hypothetical protein
MARILFRMLKLLRDDARRLYWPARNRANSSRAALFREQRRMTAAIFGISHMRGTCRSGARLLLWNRSSG